MKLDVLTDFERLKGALIGKTIKTAEIVHQDVLTDNLVISMTDGSCITIDTFLLSPVIVEGVPK